MKEYTMPGVILGAFIAFWVFSGDYEFSLEMIGCFAVAYAAYEVVGKWASKIFKKKDVVE